jgi:hypothetical protein
MMASARSGWPGLILSCAGGLLLSLLGASLVFAGEPAPGPVDFVNDVMPVLTKAGCNMGTCHAKAGGGQNGFQLSLFGYEPADDYESLVKEARGRRINLPAPDQSLVLWKASARIPHGGGQRLAPDSSGYAVLRAWIEQGAAWQAPERVELASIEVRPPLAVMPSGSTQQLQALAHYSDGSTRDVTALCLFETNAEALAEVNESGLVKVHDIPGKVAVMVRYMAKAGVFTAAVPLGAPVENLPEPANFVDELVFANLREIGMPASPVCDDATFLRRASLDVTGRLPTPEEAAEFLASTAPDKREQLIDRLLRSPGYADFFANKWTSLLKNRRDDASDITSNFAFHAWIRDSLLANVPYDQLVRELLAATGTVISNPPVAWYKRVKEPKQQIEDVAQLFLGVRLQCAQCHHHPFERWSQDDYYSLSAFFSQVGRKPTGTRGEDLIYHTRGVATAKNVRSGAELRPAALGDDVGEIPPDQDPRLRLADWMADPDNPFFAKALVNRYWKHFFGRGLIEPEDDIRDTNPPVNPELLAALERHFIQSGFDLKSLVRVITTSRAYQLSSVPNEYNLADRQNFSRYYPRRLQAEVLLDAIDDVTGTRTTFANLPPGTRAVALPDNSYNNASELLRVFGRPSGTSVCECERVQTSSLGQSLHLLNSSELKGKLSHASGRAAAFAKGTEPVEQKVRDLYLAALAREPAPEELQAAVAYVNEPVLDDSGQPVEPQPGPAAKWQDLIWALVNVKEFLFNH